MDATPLRITPADHPSLDRDVDRFMAELREERRYFGPSGRADPEPFPSLIDSLVATGDGFRLAAVECGRIVGLVRVAGDGGVAIVVAPDRRGLGIGTELGRAALARAIALGYERLVIRATRRSRAARRIGASLECTVVDLDRGHTHLVVDLAATPCPA